MAEFETREVEGMRQVVIHMQDETVRASRGALSSLRGKIDLTPRLPTFSAILRSVFTKEGRIRPFYKGTGSILLQPSLTGYHIFETHQDDHWILEPGVYWASDGTVDLGLTRDPMWASFWAGDGFLNWKTTMHGVGMVAVCAPGPVEVVDIDDASLKVQGRLVLGRTKGLTFSSQKAAKFPRNLISGQKRMRVYTGTGKLLVSWTPYWNQFMYENMTGEKIEGTIFE